MRAGRPRSQDNHSPLEGESQKPSRQAKADAVGGNRAGSGNDRVRNCGYSGLQASRFLKNILCILCIDVNNPCSSRGGGRRPLHRLDGGLRPGLADSPWRISFSLGVFLRGPSPTLFESFPTPWSRSADNSFFLPALCEPLPDLWRNSREPPPTPSWPFEDLRVPSWITLFTFAPVVG